VNIRTLVVNIAGELHIPLDVCGVVYKRELRYWQIDYNEIEPCCWIKFSQFTDNQIDEDTRYISPTDVVVEREFHLSKGFPRFRLAVWRVLNYPQTSKISTVSNNYVGGL
jgi:hypothetical protein